MVSTGTGAVNVPPVRRQQLEYQEQVSFVDWCEYQYFTHTGDDGRTIRMCLRDVLEASLNGAHLNGNQKQRASAWQKQKRAGARKSAPDISINYPVGKYHGLKIEMKKRREDYPSPSAIRNAIKPGQAEYLNLLSRFGFCTCVAYGWVEAAIATCNYFGWDPKSLGLC